MSFLDTLDRWMGKESEDARHARSLRVAQLTNDQLIMMALLDLREGIQSKTASVDALIDDELRRRVNAKPQPKEKGKT